MKRTFAAFSVLSLAFALTVAAIGQAPSAQTKPERLSKQELNTLIVSAKTPAEHERIAQYYRTKAQDYLAQAREHEAMVAMYKSNSALSNDKNQASTINHCEYFVTTFKALADNSEDLASLHEKMAKEAPLNLPSAGR